MPSNGWYDHTTNNDNVTDDGNVNGWADASGNAYGSHIAGGRSYSFGALSINYGTWGQLIYATQADLHGADLANPTGLNGHMPGGNAPDNSTWVQGHLVNGECGGSGAIAACLTPISHNINMWHASREAVLQKLVNRGATAGSMITFFNPHQIADTRLIYRTHALAPPAGTNNTVPRGICVSLGFVINGVMQSLANVQNHFNTATGNARWFADWFYGSDGANDRNMILEMVGGTQSVYP